MDVASIVFSRRSHGAAAKQYCLSSSTVPRQRQLGALGRHRARPNGKRLETAASPDVAAE